MTDFNPQLHPRNADGSGQFTETAQADAGATVLADTEALVAQVMAETGAVEAEARQAVEESAGDMAAAKKWANQSAAIRGHQAAAQTVLSRVKTDEQAIADHCMQAAVTRILMRYPQANHLELTDELGDGNFKWTVFVGGEDQPLEGPIEDDLWDAMAPVNYRMPTVLAPWCTGYDPERPLQTIGLEIDHDTQTLNRAVINLELFKGARP